MIFENVTALTEHFINWVEEKGIKNIRNNENKEYLEEYRRLFKVYNSASEEAEELGYVGVGIITYANDKLLEAQLNY